MPIGGADEAAEGIEQEGSPVSAVDEGSHETFVDTDEPAYEYEEYEKVRPPRPWGVILAASLAILAVVAWSALFGWSNRAAFTTSTGLAEWLSLVSQWSVPVLLVAVLWLIIMRSSTREAARFGNAAGLLNSEAARLESRLHTVNRELSLAREFVASQSRDLESLGRRAVDRLSTTADALAGLIQENDARVYRIGEVSDSALANMNTLREQLPVIASATKDVTNNIGNAGRTAHSQVEELVRGFKRINEFGTASETQVRAVHELVAETLDALNAQCKQVEGFVEARFGAISERSEAVRAQLDQREIEALAAIRTRAATLSEELELARRTYAESEGEALDALQTRMAALRDDAGAFARGLREDEEAALESWRGSIGALDGERSAFFKKVRDAENEALSGAERRLAELAERTAAVEQEIAERAAALGGELDSRRAAHLEANEAIIGRVAERLAALDEDIAERLGSQEEREAALAERAALISQTLAEATDKIEDVANRSEQAERRIADNLGTIRSNVTEALSEISGTETQLETITDGSVRLLELIQASAVHSREVLPVAIGESESKLAGLEQRVHAFGETVQQAAGHGEALFGQIDATETALKTLIGQIAERQDALQRQGSAHRETLSSLARALEGLEEQSEKVSKRVRSELTTAIAKLELSAREAVESIESKGAAGVNALADRLADASGEAIERAVRDRASEAAVQLEKAAADAAGISREATVHLREQLGKVAELVENLEQRVSHARERAQEQVDNDFARRVALITESLNSNAIDIAKALSTEVSDTAWEGYMRGDRGVFTRRAVSLLDSGDAKAIQQVFERDPDFREHVNRYVHDFEAILREVLSTRDGNALGVTLLSSDMGKLYVALAQAIDRFRH